MTPLTPNKNHLIQNIYFFFLIDKKIGQWDQSSWEEGCKESIWGQVLSLEFSGIVYSEKSCLNIE